MAGKDDSMFVGRKPIVNYVLARMTLSQDGAADACIKAPVKALPKALDMQRFFDLEFYQMSKMIE